MVNRILCGHISLKTLDNKVSWYDVIFIILFFCKIFNSTFDNFLLKMNYRTLMEIR